MKDRGDGDLGRNECRLTSCEATLILKGQGGQPDLPVNKTTGRIGEGGGGSRLATYQADDDAQQAKIDWGVGG